MQFPLINILSDVLHQLIQCIFGFIIIFITNIKTFLTTNRGGTVLSLQALTSGGWTGATIRRR